MQEIRSSSSSPSSRLIDGYFCAIRAWMTVGVVRRVVFGRGAQGMPVPRIEDAIPNAVRGRSGREDQLVVAVGFPPAVTRELRRQAYSRHRPRCDGHEAEVVHLRSTSTAPHGADNLRQNQFGKRPSALAPGQ